MELSHAHSIPLSSSEEHLDGALWNFHSPLFIVKNSCKDFDFLMKTHRILADGIPGKFGGVNEKSKSPIFSGQCLLHIQNKNVAIMN